MLEMLKIDLGISSTVYDTRLNQYLEAAQQECEREGVSFPSTLEVEDMQLIVMYAAFLWRKRDGGEIGMPRSLRYLLNNRIMAQKARV